jgi:hypothetical protein
LPGCCRHDNQKQGRNAHVKSPRSDRRQPHAVARRG